VLTGRPGTTVEFSIDGIACRIDGGQRQNLAVGTASIITYNAGSGVGEQRYSLPAGDYEFRETSSGWVLVKLPVTPE
jgi:hypothetical protein